MHYYVIAVLPNTFNIFSSPDEEIKTAVDVLMRPHEEGEREPYKRTCWCVGWQAQTETWARVDEELGREYLGSFDDPGYTKRYKYRLRLHRTLVRKHPWYNKPDPSCEECKGTGSYVSDFGGYWDWYRIGGRWDGVIRELDALPSSDGFNFEECFETVGRNIATVGDLLSRKGSRWVPYIVLTPEGIWYSRRYQDRSVTEYSKSYWVRRVRSLLKKYINHVAVGVDCHQ